jgi:hypothetical protein
LLIILREGTNILKSEQNTAAFVYLTTTSAAYTIQRGMLQLLMNNQLERMWKELVVAYFKVLSRISMQELKKTSKNVN